MNFYSLCDIICSIQLTIIGSSISVFVLLYSFIVTKKDELKHITHKIKKGIKDENLKRRERKSISYIQHLSNLCNKCIYIFTMSICLYAITNVISLIIIPNEIDSKIVYGSIIIISLFTLIEIIFSLYLLINVFFQYKKDIKIDTIKKK